MITRLGIDIGGTFTDLYSFDSENGSATTCKVPTTKEDYTVGVLKAIAQSQIQLRSITDIIHGSTIATNAVIERKLPIVPFITTKGFRDIIEIGRYHRQDLYDPYQTKPLPLTSRRYRYEVNERVDSSGNVLKDLDLNELSQVIDKIRKIRDMEILVLPLSMDNTGHINIRIHQEGRDRIWTAYINSAGTRACAVEDLQAKHLYTQSY